MSWIEALTLPLKLPERLIVIAWIGVPLSLTRKEESAKSRTLVVLNCFVPVMAGASPSLTLVAIEKEPPKPAAGWNETPAKRAFTAAMAPLALHTPSLKLELTPLTVAVDKLPAARLERVRVALTVGLSTSLTTMSIR